MGVPIYLITGFIESGKTTLAKMTLSDPSFNDGGKTLLLCFEEGIEEYEKKDLDDLNVVLETFDDFASLTLAKLNELDKKYQPDRVMVEFNGTWSVTEFLDHSFPKDWEFAQIVATVDTSTFENYINNMKTFMFEQLRYADLIIFNRYESSIKKTYLRGNIRAFNRFAQILYEDLDNNVSDINQEDLPFDLTKDSIEINEEDYGLWYMDAVDHPSSYENKIISFVGQGFPTEQFGKPIVAVGRYSMVCCDKDKAFLGVGVLDKTGEGMIPGEWVKVTGKAIVEHDEDSDSDYVSIVDSKLESCAALENPDVTF